MTTSRRLAAHRDHAPVAQANPLSALTAEDDETDDTTDSTSDEEMDMTEEEMQAAIAAARKEGFEAASTRFNTVTASEHYAGREQLASNLLGTDLTAEQIIAALGASAPLVAIAPATISTTASDDAAREEMRAAIQQNTNASIETGAVTAATGTDAPDQKAVAAGFAKGAAFANQINGF